jgi:hypothetical protein
VSDAFIVLPTIAMRSSCTMSGPVPLGVEMARAERSLNATS